MLGYMHKSASLTMESRAEHRSDLWLVHLLRRKKLTKKAEKKEKKKTS